MSESHKTAISFHFFYLGWKPWSLRTLKFTTTRLQHRSEYTEKWIVKYRGGNVKILQNHVDRSSQLGACNSEPSPHPFAARQQHERKMEPHLPGTQAMQDHITLVWSSQVTQAFGLSKLHQPGWVQFAAGDMGNLQLLEAAEVQLSTTRVFPLLPCVSFRFGFLSFN